MSQNSSILLIDDEEDILEFVGYNLEREGYSVKKALNGKEGIELVKKHSFDLIILDVMMPEMDGMETCTLMREMPEAKNALIVFLTARGEDYSQIAGFDAGADDYISKPIKPRLLVKRVEALLRRSAIVEEESTIIVAGDLSIDREQYQVRRGGESIVLPRKEFELLCLLAEKPGRVFGRDEIMDKIWGNEVVVGGRTIDVHVRKLREKLGDEYITTIKGVGYKFGE
ncbi:MAG: two-component system alkaline phosphatase synthesis response regulator PhoP [Flavobacteriales bacterium]|jgi:two-component system alkaline phosphatase synthesis response regulator PhoP